MRKTNLLLITCLATGGLYPVTLYADIIGFGATVNTSSLAGTAGNIEFQFAPGLPVPDSSTLTIVKFSGATISGAPTLTGLVSGSLPGTVTMNDFSMLVYVTGDYYQPITYGNSLTFFFDFNQPSLSGLAGNTFAFSMFDNATPVNPVLTTNLTDGFAFTFALSATGVPSVTNYSAQTAIFTPEPASGALLLLGISLAGWRKLREKSSPLP